MRYHFTAKSSNAKTGPIPVTTSSRETCPDACPLKRSAAGTAGCYADGGPLAIHWNAVTNGKRGSSYPEILDFIRALPDGQLWRHNQAGDLPGINNLIDADALSALVEANRGKRGFTYTHKPVDSLHNRAAIRGANEAGFTVNLSGNSLGHADELASLNIGPVVAVVPIDTSERFTTPQGRKGRVCPAQLRDTSCADCGLCAIADRKGLIIGFRAHGSGAKKAEKIARGAA